MPEFDFSSLLETPVDTPKTKIQKKIIIPTTKSKRSDISLKATKLELPFDSTKLLDQDDLEILKILARKYKNRGTNIVRHNQKNPFVQDFSRLAYMVQDIEMFKLMYQQGLLAKTKYSSQWSIQ